MTSASAARIAAPAPFRRQPVYVHSMLTERLQVLISPRQKRNLEAEAKARGVSIGELVRTALDDHYGSETTTAQRLAAVERLRLAPKLARSYSPEELNEIHGREIEEEHTGVDPGPYGAHGDPEGG